MGTKMCYFYSYSIYISTYNSDVHRVFLGILVKVPGPDFNESIGERTVRQTDRQKLWLYLAAFRCQTTKQSYKIIR